jgi:phospholipid/cholesterol/gamma-HCH transport system substrate-binding protein
MENRAHALAAGVFALMLGLAVATSVWWFSDGREPTRDYLLVSRGSVSGLNPQAQVRYRGMAAGKVTDIRIDPADPRNILVAIRILDELPVTRGTTATLGYQGVTGLASIELKDTGEDPRPLTSDDGLPPRIALEAGLMEQLTDTALDALQRFRKTVDQISVFFNDENLERFGSSMVRLESATVGIDRTFKDAPATLAAIREAFGRENLDRLSATLTNLEQASGEASPALAEVRVLMERLQAMAEQLDTTTSAAGNGFLTTTLPQLNILLKELTVTSQRLGRLVEEVESSPQVLLLGRTRRLPGPGEDGFEAARE